MTHLYIFDIHQYSVNNGVGTYISQLTEITRKWESFQLSMIMLQTNAEEFFMGMHKGMQYFFFPKNSSAHYQTNSKEICKKLTDYIDDSEETNFLLNYAPCEKLLIELKLLFPKARLIFAIHDLRWCWSFMGQLEDFKQMVFTSKDDGLKQHIFARELYLNENKQFSLADKVVCFCKDTMQVLEDFYNVTKEKIYLIPHGVENQQKISQSEKIQLRTKRNLTDEKILLTVGRISYPKGMYDYLEAFKMVLIEHPLCRWVIVGDSGDIDKFKEQAGDILSKIIFTGFLKKKELHEWYQIADVGIVPSYFEQFGFVGLEMMANGLPIVASDGYGIRCMFQHRKNALIASIGDKEKPMNFQQRLAKCTIQILNDELLQKSLRSNAMKIAKDIYNTKVMEEKYKRLLYKENIEHFYASENKMFNLKCNTNGKKSKIKLNQLNKTELSDREMNRLLGGNECCVCGCRGISSTLDNGQANEKYGYIPGDIEMGTIYGTQS